MSDSTPDALLKHLKQAKSVLVCLHMDPDGDAVGSSYALVMALRSLGKKADFMYGGNISDNLKYLADYAIALDVEKLPLYETTVLCDCHSWDRVTWKADEQKKFQEVFGDISTRPVIDHHPLLNGESSGKLWFHYPKSSSTGELCYELLKGLNIDLTSEMMNSVLTAITSDTGFFTQKNTTSRCLAQTSEMVSLGADLAYVQEQMNGRQPLRRLKLLGECLGSLELHLNGRMATILLTDEMLKKTGAKISDAQYFVNYPQMVDGVEITAFIRVSDKSNFKISMRSKPNIDCSKLAVKFGGGGHKQASAYTDNSPSIEVAIERLIAEASSLLGLEK